MSAKVVATSRAHKFKTGPLPLFRGQAKKVSARPTQGQTNVSQGQGAPTFWGGWEKKWVHNPIPPPFWGESKVKPCQPVRALAKVSQVLAHARPVNF